MLITLAGWFVFITLSLIAALHAYWGAGGLWPAATEADLVRTVIGISRSPTMPASATTFVVALLIFAAAGFAFVRGVLGFDSLIFTRIPLAVIALVMLARGIYAYMPGPFSRATEPFATLNAAYFSPLVLILGLACAWLALAPARV
ncbi:DUF3995 domain-containing protein [Maricaulis sp.]|uniref:DUF3995 domain-containing protein n=1 Tax=Maricaulis sp. TaxID=1486257 RepID=UPI003A9494F0